MSTLYSDGYRRSFRRDAASPGDRQRVADAPPTEALVRNSTYDTGEARMSRDPRREVARPREVVWEIRADACGEDLGCSGRLELEDLLVVIDAADR
jgi:hypothetical protein